MRTTKQTQETFEEFEKRVIEDKKGLAEIEKIKKEIKVKSDDA